MTLELILTKSNHELVVNLLNFIKIILDENTKYNLLYHKLLFTKINLT